MKYCGHCGRPIATGQAFCAYCGTPVPQEGGASGQSGNSGNSGNSVNSGKSGSFVNRLNEYVGNDQPANLNWRVLFSDVFQRHTREEAEAIFICGTTTTTPPPSQVEAGWPHPWLYSRVLLMFCIAFGLLWVCCDAFSNTNALPGMIVVGSFAVPLATMMLFLEVNAWRDISLYEIIKVFLVGGCASLVATLLLFSFFSVTELDFFGAFMTGIIEEVGKVVIVYYFLLRTDRVTILGGMLIGAAVGAGFAAFESAGYALQPLMAFFQYSGYYAAHGQMLDPSQMLDAVLTSIFLRGFLAPGGHVAWAAISGAALAIAYRKQGRLSTSLFTDRAFLRLFAIPVVLHGLWDCPLSAIGSSIFLVPITLLVVVWIVVLILINMGLAEVSATAQQAG